METTVEVCGQIYDVTCVSMGNPHCVIFVDDVKHFPVECIGSALEHSPMFPEGVNVEFIRVMNSAELEMRVWERGSGETMACGTGACAAVAAAIATGKTQRNVTVHLLGGDLSIEWPQDAGELFMSGPAEFVFEGTISV